jgi:hypothetical protein
MRSGADAVTLKSSRLFQDDMNHRCFMSAQGECRISEAYGHRVSTWKYFSQYAHDFAWNETKLNKAPNGGRIVSAGASGQVSNPSDAALCD